MLWFVQHQKGFQSGVAGARAAVQKWKKKKKADGRIGIECCVLLMVENELC